MRFQDKLLLGLIGGGAALWATRAYLRSRRQFSLRDKVVVVTGASSGLGLIVARMAAEQGAKLAIAARDADALDDAAGELHKAGATGVFAIPTDVSDRGQAEALIARTVEHYGRIDVLVNNAGTMIVGPHDTLTVEDYERVMATNFWGEVYPTLAAIPHMRRQGSGRIANVISVGGRVAIPHMLPYSASKFALTGFSEGLRPELVKDNIYLTAVYPGTIRTGAHPHVEVKGDHEAEYSWFALSDTIPGLATSAESCARSLWHAVLHGDPEVIVGLNARMAIGFHNLFPEWNLEVQALVDRVLPRSPGGPSPSVRGSDIRGKVPDLVNRMIPAGTRPNPA